MNKKLSGKRVLVTGAGRGLGRSYALTLAEAGADVAVTDIDLHSYKKFEGEEALMQADTVVNEILGLGQKSFGLEVDGSDEAAMATAVAEIRQQWGGLDALVNNAGGGSYSAGPDTRPSTAPIADLRDNMERNFVTTVIACQQALDLMEDGASIINVGSQAGEAAIEPMYSFYGSAKAALTHYSRYLANELGPRGIRVNVVAPGYIGTGRLNSIFEQMGPEKIQRNIALARVGTPEECADIIQFLASDESRYITGQTLMVDGGALNYATSRP